LGARGKFHRRNGKAALDLGMNYRISTTLNIENRKWLKREAAASQKNEIEKINSSPGSKVPGSKYFKVASKIF